MSLTPEDLQAIASLMDSKINPINDKLSVLDLKITDSESTLLDEIERVQNISDKKFDTVTKRLDNMQSDLNLIKSNNEVVNTLLKLINSMEQRITALEQRTA